MGYSGFGENALAAVELAVFDTLQMSFNVVDQNALDALIPAARVAHLGIIAKRPIANGTFADPVSKSVRLDHPYVERSRLLQRPKGAPESLLEVSLRFALSHEEIDVAIVGTTNLAHALANVTIAGMSRLPEDVLYSLHQQFSRHADGWGPPGIDVVD